MHDLGRNSLLILSVFMLVGGMMGYMKAKSKASLIAGVLSSIAFAGAFALSLTQPVNGLIAGLVVASLLDLVFTMRLVKTKKFMPSGLLLSLCVVTQVILVKELLFHTQRIY